MEEKWVCLRLDPSACFWRRTESASGWMGENWMGTSRENRAEDRTLRVKLIFCALLVALAGLLGTSLLTSEANASVGSGEAATRTTSAGGPKTAPGLSTRVSARSCSFIYICVRLTKSESSRVYSRMDSGAGVASALCGFVSLATGPGGAVCVLVVAIQGPRIKSCLKAGKSANGTEFKFRLTPPGYSGCSAVR
jgi:hypothetical protein